MTDGFKFKVGQKVQDLFNGLPIEILYVGENLFFGRSAGYMEGAYPCSAEWQLYQEPKKTKLVSPAICKSPGRSGNIILGQFLNESNPCGDLVVQWPARIVLKNVRRQTPVREGSNLVINYEEGDIEADLFFEVEAE